MKTQTKIVIRFAKTLTALALTLMLAHGTGGQNFTVLHKFTTPGSGGVNSDGAIPYALLAASGATLYGTARDGGSSGNGTIFKIDMDGAGFTNLHNFAVSEGANPQAGVVISGDTLYGAVALGGISGNGTVFKMKTNGNGFSVLHRFIGSDGSTPRGVIILSNTLYGVTQYGGSSGNGTVYRVSTDGTGFTNLHLFTAKFSSLATNTDGAAPYRELVLSENTLYGTARDGGRWGNGTIFKINTDGTGFTTLYHFTSNAAPFRPNSDGGKPYDGFVVSGDTLYGTAADGGANGNGTVFKIKTDGSGFSVLYHFTAVPDPDNPPYINEDGANPVAGLVLSGNTLYGTAEVGGSLGGGTVFAINTDGRGFTNLHSFIASDGVDPFAGVVLSGNTLCGTTSGYFASSVDYGSVFSLSLPTPPLTLTASGTNVIVSWPSNFGGLDCAGCNLQSATNLSAPSIWMPVAPAPVVTDGQNNVTNSITDNQRFYRLSR